MLQKLLIRNYAIIDELEVQFSSGMNAITGETGAGKSILVGALNLILGERADSSILQDPNKKCIVEGIFKLSESEHLEDFFAQQELEYENPIVIRREIASNGKSRSYINDTLVNLSQVKSLGVFLVDLHQQFDTLDINSADFQRQVIDALADNKSLLGSLKSKFIEYTRVKSELQQLRAQQEQANKELEYHQFLFSEIAALELKENELENLEEELKLLNNAENVKLQLSSITFELKNSDHPVVHQIKAMQQKLSGIVDYHKGIEALSQRLSSLHIELKDIADEFEHLETDIQFNEERVALVNDRLSAGYKLLKKHHLQSTAALLALQEELEAKIEGVTQLYGSIERLSKEQKKLEDACLELAHEISKKRQSVIDSFVEKTNLLLTQVGMPSATIKVAVIPKVLGIDGTDEISFLFDANKSGKFEAVSKVASGGELSRLMLSIKSLVAKKLALPTLVFDEIDTGISGEAAKQVGIIMKKLSEQHQLITITHQAQIAAKATAHYFVYKKEKDGRVQTGIKLLKEEEREEVIAKILSGEAPTAAALANARELLAD